MSRPSGKQRNCNRADSEQRLADARQFPEIAEVGRERGYADVAAANAVLAAIAAADAICCLRLGRRSADGNHHAAVDLLGEVDGRLANHRRRALDQKQQASYESRDVSASKADACISQARRLVEEAELARRRPPAP